MDQDLPAQPRVLIVDDEYLFAPPRSRGSSRNKEEALPHGVGNELAALAGKPFADG